jgi:hypothetical protein
MLDAEAPPARRGRRLLIALLILLLALLPLYLWPLRGGVRGLPAASALPASPPDPRSATGLARIPPEVWDALMRQGETAPTAAPSAAAPRNLTMISSLEGDVAGGLGPEPSPDDTALLGRSMIAALDGLPDPGGDGSGSDGSPSTPGPSLSGSAVSAPGTGGSASALALGGYPMLGGLGPGGGDRGLRLPGPGATFAAGGLGDPGAPAPTPEPATLLLVGSNVALLGAAAWKRRRRRPKTSAIG